MAVYLQQKNPFNISGVALDYNLDGNLFHMKGFPALKTVYSPDSKNSDNSALIVHPPAWPKFSYL